MLKILCYALFLVLTSYEGSATTLKVAVPTTYPPISYDDNGILRGLSVDVWREIANKHKIPYTLIPVTGDMAPLYEALKNNTYDVLLGPVAVNPIMLQHIHYSIPYFIDSISLLAPTKERTFKDMLLENFDIYIKHIFLFYFGFLLIYIHVTWLLERFFSKKEGRKKHVPLRYDKGIWFVFYHHITLSDHFFDVEKSNLSRILFTIYIYITIAFLAVITAFVTSTLTAVQNHHDIIAVDPQHLTNKKVGYMGNSPFYKDFFHENRLEITPLTSMGEGLALLHHRKIDCIVNDNMMLNQFLHKHPTKGVSISPVPLGHVLYHIALSPRAVSWLTAVNQGIMDAQQDKWIRTIAQRYHAADLSMTSFY